MKYIFIICTLLFASCKLSPKVDEEKYNSNLTEQVSKYVYSSNNNIDSIIIRLDSEIVQKTIYENNELIYFEFLNIFCDCKYIRYYKNGKCTETIGEPTWFGFEANFQNSLSYYSPNDTIVFFYFAPTVSDVDVQLFFDLPDTLLSKIHKDKDIHGFYYSKIGPLDKGKYNLCILMKLKDPLLKDLVEDRECLQFKVFE